MASPFKLIVGLGNPGSEYLETRHNAGFWLINMLNPNTNFTLNTKFKTLICEQTIKQQKVIFALPQTFMNRSGESVAAIMNFYKIPPNEILVAHDELALEPGVIRLKNGGGHAGHNGLKSIISQCGSADFMRIRIGIGHPGLAELVAAYVLKKAPPTEHQIIINALQDFTRFEQTLIQGDIDSIMNTLHQKNK